MNKFFKTIFFKENGTPDTFMIVICIMVSISLFFALLHEVLLWVSVLSQYHLSDSELDYMYKISFLYSVTIISEIAGGCGYVISKKIFTKNEESNG